jgi:hypothetical protein
VLKFLRMRCKGCSMHPSPPTPFLEGERSSSHNQVIFPRHLCNKASEANDAAMQPELMNILAWRFALRQHFLPILFNFTPFGWSAEPGRSTPGSYETCSSQINQGRDVVTLMWCTSCQVWYYRTWTILLVGGLDSQSARTPEGRI